MSVCSRAVSIALAVSLCACNAIVGIDAPEAFDQDGAPLPTWTAATR